jgi:hypothetical protein
VFGFFELHSPTTWSTTDKDSSITPTGLNITGGGGGASNFVSARTNVGLAPNQKIYFELTVVATADNAVFGVMNAAASTASYPGIDTNGIGAFATSAENYNGLQVGSSGVVVATGNIICVAVDGTSQMMWIRINNGAWNPANSNYSQNFGGFGVGAYGSQWNVLTAGNSPTTAFGGAAGPLAFTLPMYIAFGSSSLSTETMTLNAGSTAFAYTPPLGFRSPNSCAAPVAVVQGGADLTLDFTLGNNANVSTTRAAGGATYFDATGTMQVAAANTQRIDYGPNPGGVTNWIRNSMASGAIIGGSYPTYWSGGVAAGNTTQVIGSGVEGGISYVDIQFAGTATFSYGLVTAFDAWNAVPAVNGQNWTGSVYTRLMAGSATTLTYQILEMNSAGNLVISSQVYYTPTTAALATQRTGFTRTFSGGETVTNVLFYVYFVPPVNSPCVLTIRFGAPQLEQGSGASPWIPTSGTAVTVGATPLGLLVEESRVNSVPNSTMVGAVAGTPGTLPNYWSYDASAGLTQSVIGSGYESGIPYVDVQWSGTSSSNVTDLFDIATFITASTGQTWSASKYIRLVGGTMTNVTGMQITIETFNSSSAQIGEPNLTLATLPTSAPLASQRSSFAATLSGAVASIRTRTLIYINSGSAINFTLRFGAPQLELGSFVTSFIPTSNAAATRAADIASMAISSFANQSASTLMAEVAPGTVTPNNYDVIAWIDNNTNGSNNIALLNTPTSNPPVKFYAVAGSTGQPSSSFAYTTIGAVMKGAITVTPSLTSAAFNGGAVTVSATGTLGAIATLRIGNSISQNGAWNGWIRRLNYWPRALSNNELVTYTSATTNPSLTLDFTNGPSSLVQTSRAAGGATYFDATGTMVTASGYTQRVDYGPNPVGVTNWIRNSTMVGAVAGTPGTLPTNWVASTIGLTQTVIGSGTIGGISYVDIQLSGTTTAQYGAIYFDSALSIVIPAVNGQTVTLSYYWALTSGSLSNVSAIGPAIYIENSAFSVVGSFTNAITPSSWTRINLTSTINVATSTYGLPAIYFNMTAASGQAINFTIRIGAPQLELGSVMNTWVPTSGTVATSGATPLGLLIEESRVNSIRNSTMVGAVAGSPGTAPTNWSAATAGLTQTIVGSGVENGIPYVDFQMSGTTTSTNSNLSFELNAIIAGAQNQIWTNSFYIRLIAGNFTNVTSVQNEVFTLNSASALVGVYQSSALSITNSALATQRSTFTITIAEATTAYVRPIIQFNLVNAASVNFTLRIGAPQLELGAFATSFIPTSNAAVTRAADACTMSLGSWFNQSAFSIEAEFSPASLNLTSSYQKVFALDDRATTNIVAAYYNGGDVMQLVAGSTGYSASYSFSSLAVMKCAVSVTNALTTGCWNGGTPVSASPGILPNFVALELGCWTNNGAPSAPYWNGYIRRLNYWPRALANSELIANTYILNDTSPSLTLDFTKGSNVNVATTNGNGTYFNAQGTMVTTAAANTQRIDYGPNPVGVTNWIRNSTMMGAVAGTPGTVPNSWFLGYNPTIPGVTLGLLTGSVNGYPYLDLVYTGSNTSGSANYQQIGLESIGIIPTTSGDIWTFSFIISLQSGALPTSVNPNFLMIEYNSANTYIAQPSGSFAITSTPTRVSFTTTMTAGTASVQPSFNFNVPSGSACAMTLRITQPQVEKASSANAFVPTYGSFVTVGATPLGLLVEESRVNSLPNSTMVGAVAGSPGTLPTSWPSGYVPTGITSSIVGTGSESGIPYIDMSFVGTPTSSIQCYVTMVSSGVITTVASQVWSTSAYLRLVGGSLANITNVGIEGQSPIYTTPTGAPLASQRISTQFTASGTSTQFYFIFSVTSGQAVNFTIRIGAPQCELGSFATSFIPTSTVAVTRAADVCSLPVGSWFKQGVGSFAATIVGNGFTVGGYMGLIMIDDGTLNNQIAFFYYTSTTTTGGLLSVATVNGVGNIWYLQNAVTTIGKNKCAVSYTSGAIGFDANALTPSTSVAAVPSGMTTLRFTGGAPYAPSGSFYVQLVRYWPRALSNTELITYTT